MKPLLLTAALVLLTGAPLFAQGEIRQELKRLDLTPAQGKEVAQLVRESQADLEKARAEIKVAQAQLARLLLEDRPVRADLEKQVRIASDWDFKIKMLRIDRSLKIREIVGKDKWAQLSALAVRLLEAERQGKRIPALKDDEGGLKDLLETIRDLN